MKEVDETEIILQKPVREGRDLCVFSSVEGFETAMRMAKALYTSPMVPDTYKGEQNAGSCLIALDLSARLGLNPLMVMQSLFVVKGKPSFSGQFLIGLINGSGLFKSRLKFEAVGQAGTNSFGYRAYAYDKDGDKIYGPAVTMQMAVAEGWVAANKKWTSMPDLMLRYRAGAFFARTNCPEITYGFSTTEELEDMRVVDVPAHEVKEVDMSEVPEAEIPVAEVAPKAEPSKDDF